MPIILRQTKDAPLTVAELDGNFADLDSRINQLSSAMAKTVSIATIERFGSELHFISNTGDTIATVRLPELAAKLPVYDRATLPGQCDVGQLCVFLEPSHDSCVIFFDGGRWLKVSDNQPL